MLRSTIDNECPPDPLQTAPEAEWRAQLLTSHCVDVCVERRRLDVDDCHMWSIFANAADGTELFRDDYLHQRFMPILSSQRGDHVQFFISMFSRRQPASWTVWPYSLSRGWLERSDGAWPLRLPSPPPADPHIHHQGHDG